MKPNVRTVTVEPDIALVSQNGETGPLDEPGFRFTPTGLKINERVTFDDWAQYGRKLQLADIGIQWAIGDWLIHGENHWPDKYEQAVLATGYREGTLMNYAFVAKAIDSSRRRESVDYSKHVEVASLPEDEADRILTRAEGNPDVTVHEVRKEAQRVKRKLRQNPSEIEVLTEPDVLEFLEGYVDVLKGWEPDIPKSAPFLRNMVHAHIGQAQWQLARTVENDCLAILEMFEGGDGTEGVYSATDSDIFMWLQRRGYFMRDPELDDRLEMMSQHSTLEREAQDAKLPPHRHSCECVALNKRLRKESEGGKKDTQRGDMRDIYMLYDNRTGDAFNSRKANSIYSQGEPE